MLPLELKQELTHYYKRFRIVNTEEDIEPDKTLEQRALYMTTLLVRGCYGQLEIAFDNSKEVH
jgi:hypothetical protein